MCEITHSHSFKCVTWRIRICDMTHSYVWHDSFIRVTWFIHKCTMTHSYVCHDSFIYVTCLICMRDMTRSYVWHDSFIHVTWLIHTCKLCVVCVEQAFPAVSAHETRCHHAICRAARRIRSVLCCSMLQSAAVCCSVLQCAEPPSVAVMPLPLMCHSVY